MLIFYPERIFLFLHFGEGIWVLFVRFCEGILSMVGHNDMICTLCTWSTGCVQTGLTGSATIDCVVPGRLVQYELLDP